MSSPAPTIAPAPSWLKIPTLQSRDEEVRQWMRTHLDYLSPRRRWQTQRAALNLWMYLGRQWIEPRAELAANNGGYHFAEIFRDSNAAFPRPVTNLIAPAVDNEVSRLARKDYVPDTSAGKNNPEWMAAARLAKDILMHEISKQIWDDKREHLIFNLCIDSVAIARSWWDENDVEVTLVAAPDSVKCPTCDRYFASAKVPRLFLQTGIPTEPGSETPMMAIQHTETLEEVDQTGEMTAEEADLGAQVRLRHCPYCSQLSLLKPFEMSEKEATDEDPFGRPMGLEVPRGEGLIDVVSIHEFYPENGGLGVEPYAQRIFSQVKVRPLEWVALRVPEFREKLDAEEPSLLLKYNPLYAEQAFQGHASAYGMGTGYESYYNHTRVHETVLSPQPIEGLERGAHFIMVGDEIARRPLCIEVDTENGAKLVPRIKYHFARFKRIPGNFWGRTFVDDMIPLQRRLNEVDAQSVDLRERGKPNMWVPEGTELYYRDDIVGSLNIIDYDAAASGWSPREGLFPGIPLTGAVYAEERAAILRDMQALGAPQDIEMGQSPGSVKTTSGLMLLSEEASQKRAPRERAMLKLYESVFEHLLELNWAFRKEDATYEIQREGGIYEEECYTGADLLGNIRVKMAARVNYDQTLYNKEAAAEALQLGLYKLDTPAAVDRVLDLMKLPKDVNENQTLQITRAEMAWTLFLKNRAVPPIDPTIHDPLTWYSVLGKRWLTDQAYSMQERCGWKKIIPRIVTWPQVLAETEAAEAPAKAVYGKFPQEQWPAIQQQGEALVAQSMMAFEQAQESFTKTQSNVVPGAPPAAPPPPPPMQQFPVPPPQGFLPDPIEEKIYTVWIRMMPEFDAARLALEQAKQFKDVVEQVPESEQMEDLDALLRMRSVIEGYRILAQPPALGAPPLPPPPGGPAPPGAPAPPSAASPGAPAPGAPPPPPGA